MDNTFYMESIEQAFVGRLAKVIHISNEEMTLHLQFENGAVCQFDMSEPTEFNIGNIVIWSENNVRPAPNELWKEKVSVGTVVKLFDDQLLIESNLVMLLVPQSEDIEVSEGNTVTFVESEGVRAIISETPVRVRDLGSDINDSIESYRIESGTISETFEDFGGYKGVVAHAQELIETQLGKKELLESIGARPIKGIIFSGPPGTGKTLLAQIIAKEAGADFYRVSGPSIVSKWVGGSEGMLRRIFDDAAKRPKAIIFFDEIDSIAERRTEDTHEASKRLVAQLLTLLDGFDRKQGNIVVIAATNRIQDIDEALLRPGRFDWEVEFGMPSETDRMDILRVHMKKLRTSGDIPLEKLAQKTDGWSPAKLSALWTEAALVAANDDRSAICDEDVAEAFERISARATRQKESVQE